MARNNHRSEYYANVQLAESRNHPRKPRFEQRPRSTDRWIPRMGFIAALLWALCLLIASRA